MRRVPRAKTLRRALGGKRSGFAARGEFRLARYVTGRRGGRSPINRRAYLRAIAAMPRRCCGGCGVRPAPAIAAVEARGRQLTGGGRSAGSYARHAASSWAKARARWLAVLFGRVHFAEVRRAAGREEHRVVAEALVAARRPDRGAVDAADEGLGVPVRPGEAQRRDEPGAAVGGVAHLVVHPRHRVRRNPSPARPSAPNSTPGRAVQRGDAEAGIVGQRRQAARARRRQRLDPRIAGEIGRVLLRLRQAERAGGDDRRRRAGAADRRSPPACPDCGWPGRACAPRAQLARHQAARRASRCAANSARGARAGERQQREELRLGERRASRRWPGSRRCRRRRSARNWRRRRRWSPRRSRDRAPARRRRCRRRRRRPGRSAARSSARSSCCRWRNASASATQAPVIAAQRVPPSAFSTSQSSVIVISPIAVRSTTARSERPIRRWISCVRPDCLPRAASRSPRVWVARGSMPYSAVTQPWPELRRNGGTRPSTLAAHSTSVLPMRIRQEPSAWRAKPVVERDGAQCVGGAAGWAHGMVLGAFGRQVRDTLRHGRQRGIKPR